MGWELVAAICSGPDGTSAAFWLFPPCSESSGSRRSWLLALFPAGAAGDPSRTGVSITPYMLSPGEEKIVADRLYALLSSGSPVDAAAPLAAPVVDLTGQWDVRIEYAAGASTHVFHLRQRGPEIDGAHQGDFVSRNLSGTLDGDAVRIRSTYGEQHGDALSFGFSGNVAPGTRTRSRERSTWESI